MSVFQLCNAARHGHLSEVRRLVERKKIDPNGRGKDSTRFTPIHQACRHHHLGVNRYLIEEAHVDVEIEDVYGRSILFSTMRETHECLPIVQYLVERAGLSVHETDHKGNTPLHIACENCILSLVKYLIEHAHADIEFKNEFGNTPLHSVWCEEIRVLPIVRYLVERAGSNVNTTNKKGRTPLHYACWDLDMESVQYLVKHGKAKVDIEDCHGKSPLLWLLDHHSSCDWLISLFLTKVDSVGKRVIRRSRLKKMSWDVKGLVHRKFAAGLDIPARSYELFPVHTILRHFPLSTKALEEYVEKLQVEATLSDDDGRLPLHAALMSSNENAISWGVVSILTRLLPRSCLLRDPMTGMYPFVAAALIVSSTNRTDDRDHKLSLLSTVFGILRVNPVALRHAACCR